MRVRLIPIPVPCLSAPRYPPLWPLRVRAACTLRLFFPSSSVKILQDTLRTTSSAALLHGAPTLRHQHRPQLFACPSPIAHHSFPITLTPLTPHHTPHPPGVLVENRPGRHLRPASSWAAPVTIRFNPHYPTTPSPLVHYPTTPFPLVRTETVKR